MSEVSIPRRYAGPPESGNGGWVSGLLAGFVTTDPARPAVTVRLSSPPPLDTALQVVVDEEGARLARGSVLVASAAAAPALDGPLPAPVPYAEAQAAGGHYEGLVDHPFPSCFACSPARPADLGPGLALATGRLEGGHDIPDLHAAPWRPDVDADIPTTWAALDCPGGWAAGIAGRPMVLGTMTAQVLDLARAEVPHVVLAWPRGGDGRKFRSATALFAAPEDGPPRLLARAEAVWIGVDPATIRPHTPEQP